MITKLFSLWMLVGLVLLVTNPPALGAWIFAPVFAIPVLLLYWLIAILTPSRR